MIISCVSRSCDGIGFASSLRHGSLDPWKVSTGSGRGLRKGIAYDIDLILQKTALVER